MIPQKGAFVEVGDRVLVAKQLEGIDEQEDDIRLAFELKFSRKLSEDFQMIKTEGMISHSFIDTTFGDLQGLKCKENGIAK